MKVHSNLIFFINKITFEFQHLGIIWLQKVRNVIKMALKLLFLSCKIAKTAQRLGALPPCPRLQSLNIYRL